ncbi:MAG: CRTAC1 family protein, partial [Verrucomicrobia bacterium]|nr:CRTAC1 family protein [Verrucomicrobiota bacterium]
MAKMGIGLALIVLPHANGAGPALSSEKLNSAVDSASRTLFERAAPQGSGIDLVQHFPTNPTLDMLQDQRSGAGVCIGDYDLDGKADIYITNYDRGNRLYRNLGHWRFEDVTHKARVSGAGRWCGGATFADVDNDGDLDLYVCVFGAANLLYVNQGDGTFREEAKAFGLDFAGASVMAAFGDYDRDGLLDAYLVTGRLTLEKNHRVPSSSREAFQRGAIEATSDGKIRVSPAYRELFAAISKGDGRSELIIAGQTDYLFHNSAARRFTVVNEAAGISGYHIGLAALWWDYNEDGFPDLYVSNDYKGPDQLYRNNGNGTFSDITPNALPAVPWSSMGSDIADINNDQRIDLFATDMSGSTHARRLLNYSEPEKDRWFLLRAHPPQYRRNMLFVNTGMDRFLELAYLAGLDSTDWTWSPKFGDLDNDGWTDLFIANGMSRDFINREQVDSLARNSGWIRAPVLREANFAFRNRGDFRFENVGQPWGLDHVSASYGAALADLDRDGDLDLVVNNFDEPISVFRNTGSAGHRLLIRLKGKASNAWGIGATVQVQTAGHIQTHYLTLARGFMSANEPLVHFGLGNHASVAMLHVRWPSGREQSFEGLEADRFYTITEPDEVLQKKTSPPRQPPLFAATQPPAGAVHREREFDDFARQPLLPYRLSRLGPGVACADVDGDGDDDFYLGGAAGQS